MDSLNSLSVNKMASVLNSGSGVQQTIAIKMMKDTMTQQQDLVNKLVTNSPKVVEPRTGNSTFEAIA
jgi:hypothetical protein